jgi:hypothetical protein
MKTTRVFILCAISILTMLFSSAFVPLSKIANRHSGVIPGKTRDSPIVSTIYENYSCDLLASVKEQTVIPQEIPFGPQEDDNWPIIKQWTEVDRLSGNAVFYVLKEKPGKPGTEQLFTSCIYVNSYTLQSTNSVGGITQYEKVYYDLYNWVNGLQTYNAYKIPKTVEWWTRTSTSYTVGQNSTNWTYNGWNCSNVYSTDSQSGGFTPNWQTSTRTYDYIYDFTKNWVIKTPGPLIGFGNITIAETSPGYNNGSFIGNMSTQVRLYGQ